MHLTSGVTHHPPHWSCRTCWQKSFLAFSEALNSMTQSSTAGLQSAQSVLCDLQHSCIWLQCLCFCVWLCFAHIAKYFSKHCACDLKLMEIVLPHRFVFFCLHVFSSVAVRWSSGHCKCKFLHIFFYQRCVFSAQTEVEAKGESDRLSEEQLSEMVNKAELLKITDAHRPSGTWAFWCPESEMDKTELETGQDVRLKTRGNSPFICESASPCCYYC